MQGNMLIGGVAVAILLASTMLITSMVQESNNNVYVLLLLLWILIIIAFGFLYMIKQGINISFSHPIRFIELFLS
jgi:hypothetical protein